MRVYILRGLPGSGKSTWASKYVSATKCVSNHIISADSYHMVDGEYRYDPKVAPDVHRKCLKQYAEIVARSSDQPTPYTTLIVDNTNTTILELSPYVRLAEAYDIHYEIVYLQCDLQTSFYRNIHGVPANTILAMNKSLLTEIVPVGWNQVVFWASQQVSEEKSKGKAEAIKKQWGYK